jgi:hypothetical protein
VAASVTDLAGNAASASDKVTVDLNVNPPAVAITTAGGLTNTLFRS